MVNFEVAFCVPVIEKSSKGESSHAGQSCSGSREEERGCR